jgi:hypothetical protein
VPPRLGKCLALLPLCLIGAISMSCGSDRKDHDAQAGSGGSAGADQSAGTGATGGTSGTGGAGGSAGTGNAGQGGSGPTTGAHVQFVLKEVH